MRPPPTSATPAFIEVGPDLVPAVELTMGAESWLVGLRLRRGCRCFTAWVGDEPVAYGWLSTGSEWIGELGLEIRPPSGEAYVWNCVTLPARRLRGYFRALLLNVVAAASREGLARLWIGTMDGGAESAVVDAGFRPVLNMRVITVGGWRWLSLRPADGADRDAVKAAHSSLSPSPSSGLRRAQRRLH